MSVHHGALAKLVRAVGRRTIADKADHHPLELVYRLTARRHSYVGWFRRLQIVCSSGFHAFVLVQGTTS